MVFYYLAMNYIIFDLEATCWENDFERKGRVQEIIEIGALKVNENGKFIHSFESFVKPTEHPQLSDFCRNLTHISQIDINRALPYPEVIQRFIDWIDIEQEYLLCSWGMFDQKILSKNCLQFHLDDDWTNEHVNLKWQYAKIKGLRNPVGLHNALRMEGFEFEGTQHRGIDDARNLAKIFVKLLHQWRY